MPADQKVDYIEFPCGDFDAVQSFYEKAFGWSFMDYGPEYRAFTDGQINGASVVRTSARRQKPRRPGHSGCRRP